jgi:hypothetical protein
MDLGNGEARKVEYPFWFSFKFGLQGTIFKNATPLCKNKEVNATPTKRKNAISTFEPRQLKVIKIRQIQHVSNMENHK